MQGEGVEEDPEQAVFWFRKAASQGDVDAQYLLGMCYEEGLGVQADRGEAYEWYARAAAQGDGRAKKALKKL